MFRRIFCLITLLACIFEISAQNLIKVKDFKEADMAISANQEKVIDPNEGEYCPLVIVRNATFDGFRFPDAVKTIFGKDPKTEEDVYWVYLPCRSSKITITNSKHKLGELTYKFYGVNNLRSGTNYDLWLDISLPKAIGGKQYLTITVTPPNSSVEVFAEGQSIGDMWTVTNGKATREIDPGTYYISVSAPNYYTLRQEILFTGAEPETLPVELKPNFGYLSLKQTDDLTGAGIYIDNVNVATGTLSNHILASGTHKLKVSKELYKTYETEFTISDNQRLMIEPRLIADFATTSVTTSDSKAEIWRDGKLLGKGSWRGPLPKGSYLFETRRENHRPQQKMVKVESITSPVNITLDAPEPILGSLSVESIPDGATIEIDGVNKGTTPRSFHDILVGNHNITISLPNHQPISRTITITENTPQHIKETLESEGTATITLNSSSNLKIDGKNIHAHNGEYKFCAPVGSKHTVVASKNGYSTTRKSFTIPTHGQIDINLNQKEFFVKNGKAGYVDILGLSAPANLGINLGIGGYFSGFNVELGFIIGCQKSHEIEFTSSYNESVNYFHKNTYKGHELGCKLGYGIICGPKFMITPQAGINSVFIMSTQNIMATVKKAAALSVCGGLRFYFAFDNLVGISFVPEYRHSVCAKEVTRQMAHFDKRINNWMNGFNAKINLTFTF